MFSPFGTSWCPARAVRRATSLLGIRGRWYHASYLPCPSSLAVPRQAGVLLLGGQHESEKVVNGPRGFVPQKHCLSPGEAPQRPGLLGAGFCHFSPKTRGSMSGLLIHRQMAPGSTHMELNPELKFRPCSGLEGQT